MPDSSSWDILSGSGPVVLGVDLPARWPREAGFPDLAWARSVGIASSAYAGLPAGGRDLLGQLIRFEVSGADLLRSESVARAVVGLLESR